MEGGSSQNVPLTGENDVEHDGAMGYFERFSKTVRFNSPQAPMTNQHVVHAQRLATPESIAAIRKQLIFSPVTPGLARSLDAELAGAAQLENEPNSPRPSIEPPRKRTRKGAVARKGRGKGKSVEKKEKGKHEKALKKSTTLPMPRQVDPNREPIKVYLRMRPFVSQGSDGPQPCVSILGSSAISIHAPQTSLAYRSGMETEGRFVFTQVFDGNTKQIQLFQETTIPLVKAMVQGQNGLLFAYGVTNSGKTYTISGHKSGQGDESGMMPRVVDVIFNSIGDMQECTVVDSFFQEYENRRTEKLKHQEAANIKAAASGDNDADAVEREKDRRAALWQAVVEAEEQSSTQEREGSSVPALQDHEYSVFASYVEIYNEKVFDLLVEPPQYGKRKVLKLKETRKGQVQVKDAREVRITTPEQARKVLHAGAANRRVAMTLLNQDSSRSHSVFVLRAVMTPRDDTGNVVPSAAVESRLSIVDLAGAERTTKTGHTGERLKEAVNINTSLMNLGRVLEALRWNQKRGADGSKRHVPFRDSKLTRLFQDHFIGQGKAAMIVNISPAPRDFDETINVLKFSAIAKEVTTAVSRIDMGKRTIPATKPQTLAAAQLPEKNTPDEEDSFEESELEESFEEEIDLAAVEARHRAFVDAAIDENEALLEQLEEMKFKVLDAEARCYQIESDVRTEVAVSMEQALAELEKRHQADINEQALHLSRKFEISTQTLKSKKRAGQRPQTATQATNTEPEVNGVESGLADAYRLVAQENLLAEHEQILEERSDWMAQIDSLKKDVSQARQEKEEVFQNKRELEEQLSSEKSKQDDLARQVAMLEESYDQMSNLEDSLRQALEVEKEAAMEQNRRQLELDREEIRKELRSEVTALEDQLKAKDLEKKKLHDKMRDLEARLAEAHSLAGYNQAALRKLQERAGNVTISDSKMQGTTPVLHSHDPDAKLTGDGVHQLILPEKSKVIFTPRKKDLQKRNRKPRFSRYQAMDVKKLPTQKGQSRMIETTVFQGQIGPSLSGQGISVQFDQMEVLRQRRISDISDGSQNHAADEKLPSTASASPLVGPSSSAAAQVESTAPASTTGKRKGSPALDAPAGRTTRARTRAQRAQAVDNEQAAKMQAMLAASETQGAQDIMGPSTPKESLRKGDTLEASVEKALRSARPPRASTRPTNGHANRGTPTRNPDITSPAEAFGMRSALQTSMGIDLLSGQVINAGTGHVSPQIGRGSLLTAAAMGLDKSREASPSAATPAPPQDVAKEAIITPVSQPSFEEELDVNGSECYDPQPVPTITTPQAPEQDDKLKKSKAKPQARRSQRNKRLQTENQTEPSTKPLAASTSATAKDEAGAIKATPSKPTTPAPGHFVDPFVEPSTAEHPATLREKGIVSIAGGDGLATPIGLDFGEFTERRQLLASLKSKRAQDTVKAVSKLKPVANEQPSVGTTKPPVKSRPRRAAASQAIGAIHEALVQETFDTPSPVSKPSKFALTISPEKKEALPPSPFDYPKASNTNRQPVGTTTRKARRPKKKTHPKGSSPPAKDMAVFDFQEQVDQLMMADNASDMAQKPAAGVFGTIRGMFSPSVKSMRGTKKDRQAARKRKKNDTEEPEQAQLKPKRRDSSKEKSKRSVRAKAQSAESAADPQTLLAQAFKEVAVAQSKGDTVPQLSESATPILESPPAMIMMPAEVIEQIAAHGAAANVTPTSADSDAAATSGHIVRIQKAKGPQRRKPSRRKRG